MARHRPRGSSSDSDESGAPPRARNHRARTASGSRSASAFEPVLREVGAMLFSFFSSLHEQHENNYLNADTRINSINTSQETLNNEANALTEHRTHSSETADASLLATPTAPTNTTEHTTGTPSSSTEPTEPAEPAEDDSPSTFAIILSIHTSLLPVLILFHRPSNDPFLAEILAKQLRRRRAQAELRKMKPEKATRDLLGTECPVCLMPFSLRQRIRRLRCNHAFHRACVDPWLLKGESGCPLCRQEVFAPAPSKQPGSAPAAPFSDSAPPQPGATGE